MSAPQLPPVARRDPPVVLRSVMVSDDHAALEATLERSPDGAHAAVELTGPAIVGVDTLVGRPGASLALRDLRTVYALHELLGVLITEAEAAGLLTPAWVGTPPPGDAA